jgi:NADH-quinone oxidoreductase subunit M
VNGAVLQMVNHGVSTGALFLIVGYFYERTHTRELPQYGGVARVAPAMSAVFLVVVLSSIGLPGTNGFVGEFLVLIGTFTSQLLGPPGSSRAQVLAVVGATGVILGAVYMLWMVQRVLFGPKRRVAEHGMADLTVREWATVVPLLAAILIIGVYPQPLLNATRIPADDLIQRVTRGRAARPRGAMLQEPAPGELQGARAQGPR